MPAVGTHYSFSRTASLFLPCDSSASNDKRVVKIIKFYKENSEDLQTKKTEIAQFSSALFFEYNTQLGPPYRILVDTNFVNFAIKNKVDLVKGMMDCLYAKCIPYITDCVRGELERLGEKYRLALKVIKDPRVETLPCMHKGIYADDCLVQRVTQHKCYIVGTCDKDLKRRIRKIPGVPIMSVGNHKFVVERMPDAPQM
ncbi:unnamed protein product, partial [Meganyctiphanes norvegica]